MMKSNLNLLKILFLSLCFYSCGEENFSELQIENSEQESSCKIVYPLSNNDASTRSTSFEHDWENYTHVTLPSGRRVVVPWCTSLPPAGDVPLEIMRDVKSENGWELIAHTMTSDNDEGHNYLIFHNYVTGIMKVFYYIESCELNNMGIWRLEFLNGVQKYLNFQNEVADPIEYNNGLNCIDVTNLTTRESKSFSAGWNCFQVELAFDPKPLCKSMRISAVCYNLQSLNLSGEYQSSTNGLLITRSTSNPLTEPMKGLASLVGDYAEKWFTQKKDEGSIKDPNIHYASTRGIGSTIITAGAQYLLTSLVSVFDKENVSQQEIQLKTNGTITLDGTIDFVNQSPITSITLSCDTSKIGHLGAWNIQQWPVALVSRYGDVDPETVNEYGEPHYYISRGMKGITYSLLLNPKLKAKCIDRTIGYEMHFYKTGTPKCSYMSTIYRGEAARSMADIVNGGQTLVYSDNTTKFYRDNLKRGVLFQDMDMTEYPSVLDLSRNSSIYWNLGYGKTEPLFVKFSPQFIISINGKRSGVVYTKTFLPIYEWAD